MTFSQIKISYKTYDDLKSCLELSHSQYIASLIQYIK